MLFEPGHASGCLKNTGLNARQHGVSQREEQVQELLQFRYRRVGDIEHVFVLDRETLDPKQAARILEINPVDDRDQTLSGGWRRVCALPACRLCASLFEPEHEHAAGVGTRIDEAAGASQRLCQRDALCLEIDFVVLTTGTECREAQGLE